MSTPRGVPNLTDSAFLASSFFSKILILLTLNVKELVLYQYLFWVGKQEN
jgi:hypothetical protein